MPRHQTKTNLKSRRVQTRLRKTATRRQRTRGAYLEKKGAAAAAAAATREGLFAAQKALLVASGFKPSERAREPFDSAYSLEAAEKIAAELARSTSNPPRVAEKVETGFRRLRGRGGPRRQLSLRTILAMLLLFWIPAAEAKWNEWSAAPDDYSLFDTLYFASYFVQLSAGFAAKRLEPGRAAASLAIADIAGKTGAALRAAGATTRFRNAASGKYPMDVQQTAYMGVELLAPFKEIGSAATTSLIKKGETGQLIYTIKETAKRYLSKATKTGDATGTDEAIAAGSVTAAADVDAVTETVPTAHEIDL